LPSSDCGGGGAHGDDQAGADDVQLAQQPGLAGLDLGAVGLLVDAALAGADELEVLDRVGEVDAAALDAGLGQRPLEQLAGRADERPPLQVLLVARGLAHEDHAGLGPALAEHGLRRLAVEIAGLAALGLGPRGLDVGGSVHRSSPLPCP
jgi:hypothetical protein